MFFSVCFSLLFKLCLINVVKNDQGKFDSLFEETGDFQNSLIHPFGRNWIISGNTFIKNNFVRLTPDESSKKGGIWNSNVMQYPNWAVLINFKVHGKGSIFGDGFAFWYTKDFNVKGDAFGSKHYFTGLGIFFDTYANQNNVHNHIHPYISAMVNDGSKKYDHDLDGTLTQVDKGCTMLFRNNLERSSIMIKYEDNILSIYTQLNSKNDWIECITSRDVHLPTGYHFGFTSVTGDLSDNHDIYYMRAFKLPDGIHAGKDRSNISPFSSNSEQNRKANHPKSWSIWKRIKQIIYTAVTILSILAVGTVVWLNFKRPPKKNLF